MPPAVALCRGGRVWPEDPDDPLIHAALAARGVTTVEHPRWDDPEVDWSRYDVVVPRATWGLHDDLAAFERWLDVLAEAPGCRVVNPLTLLRWNADKRYLRDLESAGVPGIETHWIAADDHDVSLEHVLAARGWDDAIVKPAWSASAIGLSRVTVPTTGDALERARAFGGDVMVQPFVASIAAEGEISILVFGGDPSHAVRKRAARGDFRVQVMYGGSAAPEPLTPELRRVALDVLAAIPDAPHAPAYARVDVAAHQGAHVLVELELVEPQLFLDLGGPESAARWADAVLAQARNAAISS